MPKFLSLIFLLFLCTSILAQEKPVLIIFSGSDWCNNCIKLNKAVLSNQDVQALINEKFTLIEADFPRDDSHMEKYEVKRNETLADIYNAQGSFPAIVITVEGKEIARKDGYNYETPASFIQWLEKH